MTGEQALQLLLGPLGLTVGLLFLVWLMVTEKVVPRGRLDASVKREQEQLERTKQLLDIVQEAHKSIERMADAVETRNRLEEARLRRVRPRATP